MSFLLKNPLKAPKNASRNSFMYKYGRKAISKYNLILLIVLCDSDTLCAMITKFFERYHQALRKYPLCIQCLQTGILVGAGDALCQSIVEDTPILDFSIRRAFEFFGIGTFVIGPPKVYWLKALATRVTGKYRALVVIRKVILDQVIFAPFGLVLFLASLALIQGKMSNEIKRILSEDFPEILVANYKVWPVIQLLNFCFIPLQHQVLFIQTVAIIWNVYLSWRTHLKDKYEKFGTNR